MHCISKEHRDSRLRTPTNLDVGIYQYEPGFLIRAAGPLDPLDHRDAVPDGQVGYLTEQMKLNSPLEAVLTDETRSSWEGDVIPQPVTRRLGDGNPGTLNSLFRTPVHAACILRKAVASTK